MSWAILEVVKGGHALHSAGLRSIEDVHAGGGTGVPWMHYRGEVALILVTHCGTLLHYL